MAVPFIAADKPNQRSEFKQPDKSILVTTLAYYKHGLSMAQVHQLLRALEELPSCAKDYRCAPCFRHEGAP
jgi:Protein of unknown function (DUF3645)